MEFTLDCLPTLCRKKSLCRPANYGNNLKQPHHSRNNWGGTNQPLTRPRKLVRPTVRVFLTGFLAPKSQLKPLMPEFRGIQLSFRDGGDSKPSGTIPCHLPNNSSNLSQSLRYHAQETAGLIRI